RTAKSDTEGYDQYTNKTLNVSLLTPKGWESSVGIGGVYTLTMPGSDGAQIYVMSSPVEHLMGEGASPSTTRLEEYKKFRLSQMTEEYIGPELEFSTQKSSLSGNDAYETRYAYKPEGDSRKWFVREVFTVADGKVYQIQSYARGNVAPEFQNTFETMIDSYRILN
ncbi:MAG: hypothetical protein U9Q71_09355, partial [Pseudomonadota bacterium]|nr:hypothetical protein [Pseudomonadota bacterium]